MTTTQDGKKTGSAARAEAADDNSYVSKDTFNNPALLELTTTATATDAQGIERIVIPSTEAFTPAPMEATDKQKAHLEKFNTTLEEAAKTRSELLSGKVSDNDRAPNVPGDSGSQTGPASATQTEKAGTTSADQKKG